MFAQDKASLLVRSVTDLFSACVPQLIVFTEEVIEKGFAWNDNLYIDAQNNDESLRIEMFASTLSIEELQLLQLSFHDAEVLLRYREHNAAQQHYRSGLGHWSRVAKVFQEFERENQLILAAVGEGIYGVDTQGRLTFMNPAAESILGWSDADLQGKRMHRVVHHSHVDGSKYAEASCPIYESFRDGQVRQVDSEVFWAKDGRAVDVEYTSTPIYDNGHLVGAVVIFRDVSEKKRDQSRLVAALQEVEDLKRRLELENAYLQEEINSTFNHHKIIGNSQAIRHVVHKIELAAPTDITVLITGESGTGKELIARAIHESSVRKKHALIRVNCAAIPSELFESEFFGHVKGAFTGASVDRPGRFELADGGTIFLDEVAEIPLALQAKLLRVLQEQQFERVGEAKTRNVDVRIIAATNKNLAQLVEAGRFREDLYFRLNVFPIESCPLRKRIEDIPLLAQHFLNRISTKNNKPGLKIPLSQIDKLQGYSWPGNVRELENVIERQVILAKADIVRFDDLPFSPQEVQTIHHSSQEDFVTENEMKNQQRNNLVNALRQTRGKVFGPGGAAELLDVAPTTLSSRIKKYKIDLRAFK